MVGEMVIGLVYGLNLWIEDEILLGIREIE